MLPMFRNMNTPNTPNRLAPSQPVDFRLARQRHEDLGHFSWLGKVTWVLMMWFILAPESTSKTSQDHRFCPSFERYCWFNDNTKYGNDIDEFTYTLMHNIYIYLSVFTICIYQYDEFTHICWYSRTRIYQWLLCWHWSTKIWHHYFPTLRNIYENYSPLIDVSSSKYLFRLLMAKFHVPYNQPIDISDTSHNGNMTSHTRPMDIPILIPESPRIIQKSQNSPIVIQHPINIP